jgi:outer membrane protein assembly factor BamD (BamD/ComL family)
MNPSRVMLCLAGLLALTALLPACSRTATSASVTDDYDQFGDRNKTMHAEARVLTRKGEAQFEDAKATLAEGKFKSGIQQLETLIADRSIDPEIREQAMLSVAEAHGSWFNPFRDYSKALSWCEQLLDEYPDTQKRDYVEDLMQRYREGLEPH